MDRVATIAIEPQQESPVLASFPGVSPSDELDFRVYMNQTQRKNHQRIIAGETDRVEFVGTNFGEGSATFKYAVGVYNAKKGKLSVRPVNQVSIARIVKALKNSEGVKTRVSEYRAARNLLGETFGTRKKQLEIRAIERNQVDVTGLRDAEDTIRDVILTKAENMPTQEQVIQDSNLDRPIPPFDAETTEPAQVYKLSVLIPEDNMAAIHFKHLLNIKRKDIPEIRLRGMYGNYVISHLELLCDHPNKKYVRDQLKLLMYLTYMIRFRSAHERDLNDETGIARALKDTPEVIRDRLLAAFADSITNEAGKTSFTLPAKKKDTLTAYILALCLHIDGFSLDPESISADLKTTTSKVVEFCKTLGCISTGSNRKRKLDTEEEEEEAAELTSDTQAKRRRMVLVAPVKFPKPKLGMRK